MVGCQLGDRGSGRDDLDEGDIDAGEENLLEDIGEDNGDA